MNMIPILQNELNYEAEVTRKMLRLVPAEKFGWKPHEKSMTMQQLSSHLAELPSWVALALNTSELDFAAAPYDPPQLESNDDLVAIFEKTLAEGKAALEKANEADLLPSWTLRNGEQVYSVMNKYEVIRHSLNQTTHHRAQLGVFLRLLDIPIPGSYGPSADDQSF